MRSRLIKALNNRFYVKFMQLEIGLLSSIVCFIIARVAADGPGPLKPDRIFSFCGTSAKESTGS